MRAARCVVVVGAAALCAACVPDLGPPGAIPEAMQFDPQSAPPRVPQPTSLVVSPTTGHIDFSLAGLTIPADCTTSQFPSPAECDFDQYLQSLDGFPTVTPGTAPATADLDPATLTAGTNVVAVAAKAGQPVTDLMVGFDTAGRNVTVRPKHWAVGEFYWAAVRGYQNGVRATSGAEVVASATLFLLKQDTSLTCGATDATQIDPKCPAYALLSQSMSSSAAAGSLLQLEQIRQGFVAGHGWDVIAAAGIPKAEVAELWGFPIHTSSVAELDPSVGIQPQTIAPDEIHIAVQGSVDPTTVSAYVFSAAYGTVVFIDLTTLAATQAPTNPPPLAAAFPAVDISYAGGDIVIKGQAPFVVGHQYGVFMRRDPDPGQSGKPGIRDAAGKPLVPSPVSKLLTLRPALVDAAGHSTISSVADSDAAMLETGRQQLGMLFDSSVAGLTGLDRDLLVYCYAFAFEAAP
jgi:hypothetical protein